MIRRMHAPIDRCIPCVWQVVGVLEDGRTYATELVQSRKPGEGNVAQWEHELVSTLVFHVHC